MPFVESPTKTLSPSELKAYNAQLRASQLGNDVSLSNTSAGSRSVNTANVGQLNLPNGKTISNPYYLTGGNFTSDEFDSLRSSVDQGGDAVTLNQSMIDNLSKYYGKVSGLEDYVKSSIGNQMGGNPVKYGGQGTYDVISSTKIKQLANQAYNQALKNANAPDPSTVEGYINPADLRSYNQQQTQTQLNAQDSTGNLTPEKYAEWKKAQSGPLDQYQQWLKTYQATLDAQNKVINADNVTTEDTPPVAGESTELQRVTAGDLLNQLQKQTVGTNSIASQGYEATYNALRQQVGLSDLQTRLSDLNSQIATRQDIYQRRVNAVGNEPVSLDVIGGKQSEIARQEQANLNYLNQQKAVLIDSINMANSSIETIMKYKQLDYETAKAEYQQQYENALKYQELMDKEEQTAYDRSQDAQANARANLKIMTDNITSQNMRLDQLPADQQIEINKLEVQAGLPIGFMANLQSQVPDGKIITTSYRDDENNNKIADTLIQFQDGRFEVRSTLLGTNYVAPKAGRSGGGGGGGGSSAKMTSLPSGNTMTTTRYNSLVAETNKIKSENDLGDQDTWNKTYNYLAKKYTELADEDIKDLLGDEPGGGWETEGEMEIYDGFIVTPGNFNIQTQYYSDKEAMDIYTPYF